MSPPPRLPTTVLLALAAGCGGGSGGGPSGTGDAGTLAYDPARFAVAVVDFAPGAGAGYGQDALPDVVLGPPRGGGLRQGGTDVLSLGTGGTITLELGTDAVDGPGPDLIVFENAFEVGAGTFAEPGIVAVSEDGVTFTDFPCDPTASPDFPGCAGTEPVLANADTNAIDPTDPAVAGGNPFDLADIGVARARYVRITDGERPTNLGGGSEGFDLDAIAVVNAAP